MKSTETRRMGRLAPAPSLRTPWQSRVLTGCLALMVAMTASAAVAQTPGETEAATRQYAAAVSLQNRGVFDLAAAEWVRFIENHGNDPRVPRAFHYLGVCYLKNGDLPQAVQAFETVLSTYPKFDQIEASTYYLGTAQYSQGQQGKKDASKAAAATFASFREKYPESQFAAGALYLQAEAQYALDNREEAAKLYEQFLEQYPEDKLAPDALYALGVAQQELNRPKEAAVAFDKFLAKYEESPLRAEIVMRRGETFFAQKMYEPAAQWFSAAAAFDGFAMADHATLRQAAALAMQKKHAESAALYATVPAKFPDSQYGPAANLEGGKNYYLAGDMQNAASLLRAALEAGGEPAAEAAHWLARVLLKQQKPTEALQVAEKALPEAKNSPWHAALLLDRADAAYEIPARRADAIGLYAEVAAQHPKAPEAPDALYMAAFTALGEQQHSAALKHAAAFLEKHAGGELAPDVRYVAAEAHLQQKQFTDAATMFGQLVEDFPAHADSETWRVRQGLALHLQKKYQETIDALTPAVDQLQTPAAKAEGWYLIGSSRAELGRFGPAVEALKNSLAADADWRQADDTLLVLAHSQRKSGSLEDAVATIRQLIERFPDSPLADQAHYRLAEYTYAAGDFAAAEREYRRVLDDYPDSSLRPHAFYGLGWSLLSRDKFADAEKPLTQLIDDFPNHKLIPRAKYARGMARQQLGNFAAGAEDVRALLNDEPTPSERADARYVLGLCQVGMKQYGPAAKTFEALLADSPDYASADMVLYELGWARKSAGKNEPATKAFAQLTERFPGSPLAAESWYHVAEAAYRAEEYAKAAESYAAALKATDNAELGEKAAHKLGWSRYRLDQLTQAVGAFRQQLEKFPQGDLAADGQFMLAECLFRQEKHEEALAAYEKLNELGEPSTEDFQMLAALHAAQSAASLKQWEKALAMANQAAENHPNSSRLPEALYEKGWALQNLDRADDALPVYQKVIDLTEREAAARAQFMIGEIQFAKKQHREAIASFFKVIGYYGYPKWQANASYEAGRCFEVLEYKQKAIEQYEDLLKNFPKSDKAPMAKDRLAELRG